VLLHYLAKHKTCKLHLFTKTGVCCFASRHIKRWKHIHVITLSQLNHSSFTSWWTVSTRHDLRRERSVLPSVLPTCSMLAMSVTVSLCQCWLLRHKCKSFFIEPAVSQCYWDMLNICYLLLNTSQTTILSVSKTAHWHIVRVTQSNCHGAKFSTFLWSPYGIGQNKYIFMLWFVLSSSFFFPRLISAAVDWMSAILPHVVWP